MQQNYSSKFHDIILIITGIDEPNNGRMLWVADIYINCKIVTEKYFGSWNRLNEKLDNYVMDSPDGRYVFIPAEGGGFLINTISYEKICLPCKTLTTIKFLKNEFTGNSLQITYTDEVINVDLHTLK
jgi:hypothetical protein